MAKRASNPTDAAPEAQEAPTEAPEHTNEQSRGGSTPVTQDEPTLYPDTMTAPNEHAMEAAKEGEPSESTPDPLLENAPGRITPESNDAMLGTDPSTVKMITVKTTGDFQLLDVYSGEVVPHEGDKEVPETEFIRSKIETGELEEA